MGKWVFGWEEFGEVKRIVMPLVYKYRQFDEFADKIILDSELFFSTCNNFNDPFDCNLEYNDDEIDNNISDNSLRDLDKRQIKDTIEKMKNTVGILSMSKNYKNILMWSHYSKNHEGLCFGFERNIFEGAKGEKVNYSKNKRYDLIFSLKKEFGDELKRLFLLKSKYWKYEEEFRFIGFGYTGVRKYDKNKLKQIIFGCKADETNIKKIIQLCQLNGFEHVVFKKARIVSGRFELDFDEIDKNEYL